MLTLPVTYSCRYLLWLSVTCKASLLMLVNTYKYVYLACVNQSETPGPSFITVGKMYLMLIKSHDEVVNIAQMVFVVFIMCNIASIFLFLCSYWLSGISFGKVKLVCCVVLFTKKKLKFPVKWWYNLVPKVLMIYNFRCFTDWGTQGTSWVINWLLACVIHKSAQIEINIQSNRGKLRTRQTWPSECYMYM